MDNFRRRTLGKVPVTVILQGIEIAFTHKEYNGSDNNAFISGTVPTQIPLIYDTYFKRWRVDNTNFYWDVSGYCDIILWTIYSDGTLKYELKYENYFVTVRVGCNYDGLYILYDSNNNQWGMHCSMIGVKSIKSALPNDVSGLDITFDYFIHPYYGGSSVHYLDLPVYLYGIHKSVYPSGSGYTVDMNLEVRHYQNYGRYYIELDSTDPSNPKLYIKRTT